MDYIDRFKTAEDCLIFNMSLVFDKSLDPLTNLRTQTFYNVLSESSQQILNAWVEQLYLNPFDDFGIINFVKFISQLRKEDEYIKVIHDINLCMAHMRMYWKQHRAVKEDYRYFVRYYDFSETKGYQTVFKNSIFSALMYESKNLLPLFCDETIQRMIDILPFRGTISHRELQKYLEPYQTVLRLSKEQMTYYISAITAIESLCILHNIGDNNLNVWGWWHLKKAELLQFINNNIFTSEI